MFLYLLLALFVPGMYLIFRSNAKRDGIVLISTLGMMFVILCLRNPSGFLDLPIYDAIFDEVRGYSFMEQVKGTRFIHCQPSVGVESGYIWLNWIISHLGGNFNVLLCVHAAVLCISLYFFIRKYSLSPAFSLFFFFCIGGLDDNVFVLRQSFAFAILLFAFTFVVDRKPVRFILLVLLAAWFQRVALSFLIIYPISYIRLTRKTGIAGIIISLSMLAVVPLMTNTVIPWLFSIFGKAGYLNHITEFKEVLIILLGLHVFALCIADFSREIPHSDEVAFWLSLCSMLFVSVSVYIGIVARIGMNIFLPFAMIMLPNFMVRNRNRALMDKLGIALYIALFAYLVFLGMTTPFSFSFVWESAAVAA